MTSTDTHTPTVAPIPAGYTSLTPFLVVSDGAGAIDFYTSVFGAQLTARTDAPDGTVAHAELDFGHGRLQLGDANPTYSLVAPTGGEGPVTHSICLYCEDVDAVVARARAAGATVREEVSTFVTGDRFGSILDPFGQRWAIMTRVEDVSDDEAQRRVDAWMAEQG